MAHSPSLQHHSQCNNPGRSNNKRKAAHIRQWLWRGSAVVSSLVFTVYPLAGCTVELPFFLYTNATWAVSSGYSEQIWSVGAMLLDMRTRLQQFNVSYRYKWQTNTRFTIALERSIDDGKSWGSCRLALAQLESPVLAGSPVGLIFPLKVNLCARQPQSFCINLKTQK